MSHEAAASTINAITTGATTRPASMRTARTTAAVVGRAGTALAAAPRPVRGGQVVEQLLELAVGARAQGDVQALLELAGV